MFCILSKLLIKRIERQMNKRKISLIIQRLKNLPKGFSLFLYLLNMLHLLIAKKFKLVKLPIPDTVMLEVTNNCQLKCKMCGREYKYGKEMDCGNMDFEKVKTFIDKYGFYFNRIALTGLGEPLLYPKLKELAQYIKSKNGGTSIFISINAQLPNLNDKLKEIAPFIDTFQVSLDGVGEVYNKIRAKGEFETVEKNIKTLVELQKTHKFHLTLNTVVFSENSSEMESIVSFAKDQKIREVTFNTLNQVSFDKPWHDDNFYNSEQFKNDCSKAESLARDFGIEYHFAKYRKDLTFADCPYIWGHLTITWDGYLVPCCAKPFPKELNFGNIFNNSLLNCVNDKELVKFRRLSKLKKSPQFCKNCHYSE